MTACETLFSDAQLAVAREELVFGYDTQRFPFDELFRRMFQLEDGNLQLSQLHTMELCEERAPLSLALLHGFKVAGRKCPAKWNKALARKKDRLRKFVASKAYRDFHEVFLDFVRQVIVPLIGDKYGLVFQDPPTFRVQLPSNTPIGKAHKDSDYASHVDTEINIWVPVTNVWGQNTLQTESEPGLGDFHPLEARYGEAVRFWGNQCTHFTVPNSTDHTRVSFDFRVIPRSRYTHAFRGYIGDYPTASTRGPHEAEGEAIFQFVQHVLCLRMASQDISCDTSKALADAAQLGCITALGACFFFGIAPHSTNRSYAEHLWGIAASHGDPAALTGLAMCEWQVEASGDGRDPSNPFRRWRRAARKGDAAACCSLVSIIFGDSSGRAAGCDTRPEGSAMLRGEIGDSRCGREEQRDAREGISREIIKEWLACAERGGHQPCLDPYRPRMRRILGCSVEEGQGDVGLGTHSGTLPAGVDQAEENAAMEITKGRFCWVGWRSAGGPEWGWVKCVPGAS